MSTFTPSAEQAAIIDAPVDADVLVVAYQSRCGT